MLQEQREEDIATPGRAWFLVHPMLWNPARPTELLYVYLSHQSIANMLYLGFTLRAM